MQWTSYHLELAVACRANLCGADLHGANLRGANLHGANLREADLHGANLCGADLREADLCGADLRGASLHGADLRGANLHGANLREADLRGADLCGANLCGADLRGADLAYSIVPEKGSFTGFKKLQDGIIAEVEIPKNAGRVGGLIGRKCRAEFVKVLKLSRGKTGLDTHSKRVKYAKGRIVRPDSWDPDIRLECTHGIHFFLTRKEAEEYNG